MADLLNGDRVVSAKERKELIPFSDAHWNRLERAGKVPNVSAWASTGSDGH